MRGESGWGGSSDKQPRVVGSGSPTILPSRLKNPVSLT
jgi:hypothetical protein